MKHSESIAELTEALAKAQGAFPAVQKGGVNPHLKNRYSTLDDIIAAVRKPLAENGLSFVQPLTTSEDGTLMLETVLFHQSSEWMSSTAPLPTLTESRGINEMQAFGSALTYMRRYMLSALLGVTSEEDADGNGASGNGQKPTAKKPPQPPRKQKANTPAATPKVEPVPPDQWDDLPVPADFTELWGEHRFEELGYKSMEHVKNTIAKVYPDEKLGTDIDVGRAWLALVDYAKAKEADDE